MTLSPFLVVGVYIFALGLAALAIGLFLLALSIILDER